MIWKNQEIVWSEMVRCSIYIYINSESYRYKRKKDVWMLQDSFEMIREEPVIGG